MVLFPNLDGLICTMVDRLLNRLYRLRCSLSIGVVLLSIAANQAAAADFTYVVRPGDNLWNLTERYLKGVEYWPRLLEYNRVLFPHALRPGSSLLIPLKWLRREAIVVRVVGLHGYAEVQRGEQISALKSGVAIAVGEVLRTGADGNLTLEFPDGSRSSLGPNSEMRMSELWRIKGSMAQQVSIKLPHGYMENEVGANRSGNARFIIDTPSGVAAVRGTRFRVDASEKQVRAETLRGEVILKNARGQVSLRSATGSLAQAGQAPTPPRKLLSAPQLDHLPDRVERLPLDLPFPAVRGASAYRTQLATAADFSSVDSDQISLSPRTSSTTDLTDARYRLRVRAIDANGLQGIDAEREIEINAHPEPPFPSQPVPDGVVGEENPEFRWALSGEAGHYHFQLASDKTFRTLLLDADKLVQPSLVYQNALPPGEYYWRVALATAAEGQGPFSDPQRFRRPPPGPLPEPPQINGDNLELRWRTAGPDDRYQVQLAGEPSFQELALDRESAQPIVVFTKPSTGTYFMRVRTLPMDGPPGPWGKPQKIELPPNYWPLLWMLLPVLLILP